MSFSTIGLDAQEEARFAFISSQLSRVGGEFYRRGWLFGTSGNLSSVLQDVPLKLAITASGVDKGQLDASRIIEVDKDSRVVRGNFNPSSETLIHIAIVKNSSARAVFHTHSVWSTILSDAFAHRKGIELKNYEMLKGLSNVKTHEHREWIPIIENSQDVKSLSTKVEGLLREHRDIHGVLLRGHGLYTWGSSIEEAKRHVEVLEFMLEIYGRTKSAGDFGE